MKRHLFFSLACLFLVTGLLSGCSGQPSPTTPPVEPTPTASQPQVSKTDESLTTATPLIEPTSQPESDETSKPETPVVSHGGLVTDYVSLIDQLRAAGATVEPAGEVLQPFFSVKGQVIKVNGEDVQVFEYTDAAAAEAEATSVSPDGGSVGTSMVTWVAAPHFYKTGRLIVLYVGDNQTTIVALETALGPQFAGR
jgi:hypothetical protein